MGPKKGYAFSGGKSRWYCTAQIDQEEVEINYVGLKDITAIFTVLEAIPSIITNTF